MNVRIVIPCYNEASRLPVARFDEYLASRENVGFVLVNDGSRDGTLDLLQSMARRWPGRIVVIDQQPNQGKAEAVRSGMRQALSSGAEFAGFWDADLATPLTAIDEFVQELTLNPGIEFMLGARIALLGRRVERKTMRHYLGRVFATAASLTLGLPVYDTQCGAKLMRASARIQGIFAEPFLSRWVFDVEMIARYLRAGGSPEGLYEMPLREWRDVGESKVKAIDFVRAIGELSTVYSSRTGVTGRTHDIVATLLASRAARYVAVGAIGTGFHYLTLIVAVEVFRIPAYVGSGVGAVLGALVNYLLNYHVTFISRASHKQTATRFAIVAAVSVALNSLGMWLTTQRLGLPYLVGQVICTVIVLAIGYLLNKSWTFASARASRP